MPPASLLPSSSTWTGAGSGASESQEWAFQREVEAALYGNSFAERVFAFAWVCVGSCAFDGNI